MRWANGEGVSEPDHRSECDASLVTTKKHREGVGKGQEKKLLPFRGRVEVGFWVWVLGAVSPRT